MKALKIKLYQNLCNYKKEGSFGYVQTYPLPTPSMVRGLVHNILEANEYIPLKISIQGKSDAVITNMQRVYKFDRDPVNRPDNPYLVKLRNSMKTATHGILFVDLHVNIRLILHICFKDDNEEKCKKLYKKSQEIVPVLGRNEDIALIEDIRIVDVNKFFGRKSQSKFPMFVSKEALIENVGTKYRLPFWYERVEDFDENRIFHFIEASYISENIPLRKDVIMVDDENDIVYFLTA
ncbi:MAG: CRISPR-associated protein (Cas_Cas5) [Spirochaetes bacterium ADurb.Bin218]|jgi:CRISPR-associated protein Cas5t|nr:MAG: CRISPR-associated protein (Cas_Cas5) [Spirochaetes bacterium ADurb.Bin218]